MKNTPKLVRPGDPIRASQFNDLQRAVIGDMGQAPPVKGLLRSGCVFVKNTTGAAVKRYSSYSLGNSRWTLDRNRNLSDCIFDLVAYSASLAIAVVQEPLGPNEFGLAVVEGSTLVEINGSGLATDQFATPQSDGRVQATATGPIRITQGRPAGGGFVLGLIGIGSVGGAAGLALLTAAAAAATITYSPTPTSLTCPTVSAHPFALTSASSATVDTSLTLTLRNTLPLILPENSIVQWKENQAGQKMIDTWVCGSGGLVIEEEPG